MMLGFSGINYTAWLYLAWLPGYLQTAYNLDLKSTGLMAAIPFLFGAAGMLVNGYVTDWLVKGGMAPIKSRKDLLDHRPGCSVVPPLRWSYRKRQHP